MQKNEAQTFISVIIPAYNEESNLAATLKDVFEYLSNKPYSCEVIVVNDGSKDNTAKIAKEMAGNFKSFVFLEHYPNRGKGFAIARGVEGARGDYILFMDADNATRIDQLDELLAALQNDHYDVAIGSRRLKNSHIELKQPMHRSLLGSIYVRLAQVILGTNVHDYNCGFKLYKRAVAQDLFSKIKMKDWSFDTELIYLIEKSGYRLKEIPIRWHDKKETSKVKPLRDGIKAFCNLFRIRSLHGNQ